MPAVLDAARRAAAASPGSRFLNMSNPMGILLNALSREPGIRSLGLCELPALTLEKAAAKFGLASDMVEADYLGLNHQGWFVRLRHEGRDLLPPLFEAVDNPEDQAYFKVESRVMKEVGAPPLPYMRIYYHRERETERMLARNQSRGDELGDLATRLYAHYRDCEDGTLPEILTERGLIWFRMALVPALSALLGMGDRELFVSERNGGDVPGLPVDCVVEKRCVLRPEGTRFIPFSGPAPERDGALEPYLAFLRKVARFEDAALEAALDPRPKRVIEALMTHPLGIDRQRSEGLVDDVLRDVEAGGKENAS